MRRAADRGLGCARSLPLNSVPTMRDSERRGRCAKRSVETRDELTGQVAGLASHGISHPQIWLRLFPRDRTVGIPLVVARVGARRNAYVVEWVVAFALGSVIHFVRDLPAAGP
jgi:hypothetical protein